MKAQLIMTESAIEEAQRRRQHLLTRLESLDLNKQMPEYEVSLKSAESVVIASIRETIATPEQITERWNELFTFIATWMESRHLRVGIPVSFYHDEGL